MTAVGTRSSHAGGRWCSHPFSLMEAAVGIGVAAILLTCYSTLNSMAFSAQRRTVREYHAVVVLDNVVERLEAQNEVDLAKVQRTIAHEFAQSMFSQGSTVTWQCRQEGDSAYVALLDAKKAALSEVGVPLK